MKIIGLTGGIGSGKSTVAKVFSLMNIPVYDSDTIAKSVYLVPEIRKQVIDLLGDSVYQGNRPDHKQIASVVFSNTGKLAQLNAIIHPWVKEHFQNWCGQTKSQIVIKESALIFELGLQNDLDATILVVAPEEIRIKRVMDRSGISKEEVKKRIQNQWPDEKKVPLADYIIRNDESELLIPQILDLSKQLVAGLSH